MSRSQARSRMQLKILYGRVREKVVRARVCSGLKEYVYYIVPLELEGLHTLGEEDTRELKRSQ